MKIVKQGSAKWWVGREVTCPMCESVFELEEIDEPDEVGHDLETMAGEFHCIVCDYTMTLQRDGSESG